MIKNKVNKRTITTYDFNENIINAIDINPCQQNYALKYSDDALENQLKLFKEIEIEPYFHSRVVMASPNESQIKEINNFSLSNYTGHKSNCNDYDAIFTQIPNLPLFSTYGDCPILLFTGKNTIGLVHASRKTIDEHIIEKFMEQFIQKEKIEDIKVGFSPYIFQENFSHEYLGINRQAWLSHMKIEDEKYNLNLKTIIEQDLNEFGITQNQIFDNEINTYTLSKESYENGGYQISHRQATQNEGRGGLVIMLQNKKGD